MRPGGVRSGALRFWCANVGLLLDLQIFLLHEPSCKHIQTYLPSLRLLHSGRLQVGQVVSAIASSKRELCALAIKFAAAFENTPVIVGAIHE